MKKVLFLLLAYTFLLAGCNKTPQEIETPGKIETAQITETILNQKEIWPDNTVLYALPNEAIEGAVQSKTYRYGDNILVVYDYYVEQEETSYTYFKLVSMETGELLCESAMEFVVDLKIQVINDNLIVHDWSCGKTYVLDENLEIIETHQFDSDIAYFDKTGENVFQFSKHEGITIENRKTGKKTKVLENARNIYVYGGTENEVSFTYIDIDTRKKQMAYINLENHSIKNLEIPKALSSIYYGENTWFGPIHAKGQSYFLGNEDNKMAFDASMEDIVVFCQETGHLMVFTYDKDGNMKVSLYDKEGKFISSCNMRGLLNYLMEAPAWYEEYQGYIFTMINEDGQDELLFWDVSKKMYGEDLELYPVENLCEAPKGNAVSEDLYARAEEISEKYGVQILIADQCDTEFQMYTATKWENETDIAFGLDEIEKALVAYPKGFFEQLKFDSYSEIEIHLLGEIEHRMDDIVPIGFVDYNDGTFVVGIDIRGILLVGQTAEQIFYHEVSHMVDIKLELESEYIDNGYSDTIWREMNPTNFVYTSETGDNTTMYWEYMDCFIDDYATTDPSEDRARILEHACFGYWDSFAAGEIVRDKYEYYCECIRKGFDTNGWPDVTFWENAPW